MALCGPQCSQISHCQFGALAVHPVHKQYCTTDHHQCIELLSKLLSSRCCSPPPPPVHLINREPSLSPGRGKEESNGVSAPPQLHSLAACSADCSVLHLCPSRLLCCGPRRSAKQTHSPAIWAKQRPRLQSVVVQQQEGNTGRAAAAAGAGGGTTAADRYCRLEGGCCMLVPAAMQPTLAVPPAMGAFACPGTFQ